MAELCKTCWHFDGRCSKLFGARPDDTCQFAHNPYTSIDEVERMLAEKKAKQKERAKNA